MPGETDLPTLLKGLTPVLDKVRYAFVCVPEMNAMLPVKDEVRGVFVEKEGVTLIIPVTTADAMDWPYEGVFRCITCDVYSSLDAVGLTAAMTTVLTNAGISANVVAAYYHDHLFVPEHLAERAVSVLGTLTAG